MKLKHALAFALILIALMAFAGLIAALGIGPEGG
jgi:hypothetical protein